MLLKDLTPELWIEDVGQGKRVAVNTRVEIIPRDREGVERDRFDISSLVRSCNVTFNIGDVITADLSVFVTGFRAEVGLLRLLEIRKPEQPKAWKRRLRDVTTFGSRARRFA